MPVIDCIVYIRHKGVCTDKSVRPNYAAALGEAPGPGDPDVRNVSIFNGRKTRARHLSPLRLLVDVLGPPTIPAKTEVVRIPRHRTTGRRVSMGIAVVGKVVGMEPPYPSRRRPPSANYPRLHPTLASNELPPG